MEGRLRCFVDGRRRARRAQEILLDPPIDEDSESIKRCAKWCGAGEGSLQAPPMVAPKSLLSVGSYIG
jgi:hypothetical protein